MTEKEKAAWIDGAKTAINCMRFTLELLELLERDLPELADKAEDEGRGEAEARGLS